MTPKFLGLAALALMVAASQTTPSRAQEDDFLAAASKLTGQSSELQKVQDQIVSKREEIKKESAALKVQAKKVEDMKAAAKGGDAAPLVGPFTLFIGQFSNTADLKGNGTGEKFDTFPPARAKGEKHRRDNATKQPSYRIEDKNGTVIEAAGLFANKKVSKERLAASTGPKPDPSALKDAEKSLATKQSAFDDAVEKYRADKAKYDRDLDAYNSQVDRLNASLPTAIRDAGSPTPSADDLAAPKGDYQADDLSALATKYKGEKAKDGSAAAFVQDVAKLPEPAKWGMGAKVEAAKIRPGTPIATFKADGKYAAGKGSHAAIFITKNKTGIWVYDQYKTAKGEQKPVEARFIRFKKGKGSPSNDASAYSVIKKKVTVPDLPPDAP